MQNRLFFLGLFFISLITSCSVGPKYRPPIVEVPSEWKHPSTQEDKKDESSIEEEECSELDYWWQVFKDEQLEKLELIAIENNKDLMRAFERIQEAHAIMKIAAADFYPQLTLNPSSTNSVELIKNFQNTSNLNTRGSANTGNAKTKKVNQLANQDVFRVHDVLYFLPLDLSYEVDLWGKIRDQYRATKYQWLGVKKDYEFAMLNLTSQLATFYYQIRVADTQLDLLSAIFKTRQKALKINQDRYEEQITFYADVTLAEEELFLVINQQEEVKRQRDLLENQLAILLGIPASNFNLQHSPLQSFPPVIPAGIPSDILLRRPDLVEAEYAIKTEHELIKQAHALFYPSLTLTASGGFQSPTFKDFLKWMSRYWMDSVQIGQVIFDGGRLSANLKLKIAQFQEANDEYKQQVLIAFQEVENALTNVESFTHEYENASAIAQLAQKTYQLYLDRYLAGVIYYINVTDTERDLLNYQLNVAAFQGYRYIATIQLIRALGGGW